MQNVKKARATLNKLFPDKDWPRKDYLGNVTILDWNKENESIIKKNANRDGVKLSVWLFHNCENKCRMFSTDGDRLYELKREGNAFPQGLFKRTRKKPKDKECNLVIKVRPNGGVNEENNSCWYGLRLQGADLREADLWGAKLRGANLRGADLRGANLRGADLWEADLWEAHLRGADLREANLRRADLRRADLRRANLREADLRGADLRGADNWQYALMSNETKRLFEKANK